MQRCVDSKGKGGGSITIWLFMKERGRVLRVGPLKGKRRKRGSISIIERGRVARAIARKEKRQPA